LANYMYTISTPAGNTKTNPLETPLAISYGIIHFIGIYLVPGSQGECHVVLLHERDRVAPTNPEEDYSGDDTLWPIKEHYPIETGPAILTALTWNDSEDESRKAIINVQVLPEDILLPTNRLTDALQAFLQRLRVPLPWVTTKS